MASDSGMVTHQCFCGGVTFKVLVTFQNYEIATYSTDMYCEGCGSRHRSPTLVDKPMEGT